MRRILLIFFIAANASQLSGQCGPYINYASCNDAVGTIYYSPMDCGPNTMIVWSTGDTGLFVNVLPGLYSADFYVNNIYSFTDTMTMFHNTWNLSITPVGPGALHFDAYLPWCNTSIFTHPSCTPPYPNYAASLIVWEDGNQVDTLNNVFCTSWSTDWYYAQQGHYYDISIYDTTCNCYQATWMSTPVQTYYYPIITGGTQLNAQVNKNETFIVFNTLGKKVYSGKNTFDQDVLSPGIYFIIYYDGIDSHYARTGKLFVNSW